MVYSLLTDIPQAATGNSLTAALFLQKRKSGCPVVDVRSPAEYKKGHIPGAGNMPLFNDEERALVGTLYAKSGKEDALSKSLEIIGPKLQDFAQQGLSLSEGQEVLLYCWRGGMRSAGMARLFGTIGITASVLDGGYKSYRRHLHDFLALPFRFIVIGGMTGSGKTEVLAELEKMGYPVVDLERLAHHKGSVFGAIGEPPQPTTEHFENLLFERMALLKSDNPVFIEDESISIGSVFLPGPFHRRMLACPLLELAVPYEDRIDRLVKVYAGADMDVLTGALARIERRIGTEDTQKAVCLIREGRTEEAVSIILRYYDKVYNRTRQVLHKGKEIITLELIKAGADEYARQVIACLLHKNLL